MFKTRWPPKRRNSASGNANTQSIQSPLTRAEGHIGNRRQDCWWEPIYGPDLVLDPSPYDWDIARDSGPSRRFICSDGLNRRTSPGVTFKLKSVTFRDCDFQGEFSVNPLIMFDGCHFINCDFAYSNWRNAHFRACKFEDCSIALSTFSRCEFRECNWTRLGLSSRTELHHSFISNPDVMVSSSVSHCNPSDKSWNHRAYQWQRLQGTRAHFLRAVMISHQTVGDEHTYYSTVKAHELQSSIARMARQVYGIVFERWSTKFQMLFGLLLEALNYIILSLFGWLNKWGQSVSQPCIALLACYLIFGLIYQRAQFSKTIETPFQKSFDITIIAGYGSQIESSDPLIATLQDVHVVIAIAIYSVFFATLVSKLSRAR